MFRKRLREQSLYFRRPPFSLGRDPATGFYSFLAPAPHPSHRESVVTRKPWGGERQQVLFCTLVKQAVTGHRGSPWGVPGPPSQRHLQAASWFQLRTLQRVPRGSRLRSLPLPVRASRELEESWFSFFMWESCFWNGVCSFDS